MAGTLPHRYDDSASRGHGFPNGEPDDGVARLLDVVVVGHADDHPAGAVTCGGVRTGVLLVPTALLLLPAV